MLDPQIVEEDGGATQTDLLWSGHHFSFCGTYIRHFQPPKAICNHI